MVSNSENTQDTEIKVTVYKDWNIKRVIKDIEKEHNKIHETPFLFLTVAYPARCKAVSK